MSATFVFPPLGESVGQGTVTRWLRQVGESVTEGEPLVEIATDKVDTEVTADFTGVIVEILVEENSTVEVGHALATYATSSDAVPESAAAPESAAESAAAPAPGPAAPAAAPAPAPATPVAHSVRSRGQFATVIEVDVTRVVGPARAQPSSLVAAIADAQTRVHADGSFPAALSIAPVAESAAGVLFEIPTIEDAARGAALGVGAVVRRVVPVGEGDAIGIRSIAHLCLTCADDTIDGAEAARYLAEVRRILETATPA